MTGAAAVLGIAALPAGANPSGIEAGYDCRAVANAAGTGFTPCVSTTASADRSVKGSLETTTPNRAMDWWISLWRVNADGSTTLVTSHELGNVTSAGPTQWSFGGQACNTYVVGVGYWLNGTWTGPWESPRWGGNCSYTPPANPQGNPPGNPAGNVPAKPPANPPGDIAVSVPVVPTYPAAGRPLPPSDEAPPRGSGGHPWSYADQTDGQQSSADGTVAAASFDFLPTATLVHDLLQGQVF